MIEIPESWTDLINALTLLSRHANSDDPTYCAYEQLTVFADPAAFTADEIRQLHDWGFIPDIDQDDCFVSFRFGSC